MMSLVKSIVERLSAFRLASFFGTNGKRKTSAFASLVSSERLEDRALLSAVSKQVSATEISTAASKFFYTPVEGEYLYSINLEFSDGAFNLGDQKLVEPADDSLIAVTQKFDKDDFPSQTFTASYKADVAGFTFKGKFDKGSSTNFTGTYKGNITLVDPNGNRVSAKLEGKGKASLTDTGTVDSPEVDTTAIDIVVTLTKDVKLGKGRNAVTLAKKGAQFAVGLDAADIIAGLRTKHVIAGRQ